MPKLGQQEATKEELEALVPKVNGYASGAAVTLDFDSSVGAIQPVQGYIPVPTPVKLAEPPKATPLDYSQMITTIAAWKDILNARLLALLSLIGAMVGFGFCMYQPDAMRLWGLGIYSVLVIWPVMALYLRKG